MRRRFAANRPLLALGTIAASSLALAGCAGEPPGEVMFTSAEQCIEAGMDQQVCLAGYQDAMQAHWQNAPRFDGLAACEAEYGAGQCGEAPAAVTSGGGSFFVPFLAGYMMSSALNNLSDYGAYRRQRELNGYGYGTSPIYRNRSGQTVTPGTLGRQNGTAIAPSQRSMQPVNVNTQTVARSGFGGRSGGWSLGG